MRAENAHYNEMKLHSLKTAYQRFLSPDRNTQHATRNTQHDIISIF